MVLWGGFGETRRMAETASEGDVQRKQAWVAMTVQTGRACVVWLPPLEMIGQKVQAHCAVCVVGALVGALDAEVEPLAWAWGCSAQSVEASPVSGRGAFGAMRVQIRALVRPLALGYCVRRSPAPGMWCSMPLVWDQDWEPVEECSPADLGREVRREQTGSRGQILEEAVCQSTISFVTE